MPWLDAAWHPPGWLDDPVPFDASDRGLLLGDGVFDTSLVLGGRMVWRAAHLHRLRAHALTLGFAVNPARLETAVDGTLERLVGGRGALRLTLTRGPGPRGLAPPAQPHPTILATFAPWPAASLFAPMTLHRSAIRRNETSPSSRAKTLGYGDAVLAAAAARAAGCDDALFLNGAGQIACAGTANLFAVFGRELVTPPLADGVLDGVTRAVLMKAAARLGWEASERSLGPLDLAAADTIICTSSLRLVAEVTAIGGEACPIGEGTAAALACAVAEAVEGDVGLDPRPLADAAADRGVGR